MTALDLARLALGWPKCRFCERPVKNSRAVVCDDPACEKKWHAQNNARYAAQVKAQGMERDHGRTPAKEVKIITRTCQCGKTYRTELTFDRLPRFRFCQDCRERMRTMETGAMG